MWIVSPSDAASIASMIVQKGAAGVPIPAAQLAAFASTYQLPAIAASEAPDDVAASAAAKHRAMETRRRTRERARVLAVPTGAAPVSRGVVSLP